MVAASIGSKLESPVRWATHSLYCLRMDVDVVVNFESNWFAIGGVVRDHVGKIIIAFGQNITKPPSVVYAELMAIREGIALVQDRGLTTNFISFDSLLAVKAIIGLEEDRSINGAITNEIRSLLSRFTIVKLFHIRRSANVVANAIAHFVSPSQDPFIWDNENFPFWLVDLVTNDIMLH
ncbi:uncharacterized protein [Henckelia pumila]|uniref:uncharacterized protein n=1 Tax=Henckelia pumila TaxID=405737 RepID=UPI003C6E5DF9